MPGPAITALSLSHFRSHLGARLAFDGRVVTLTGPNGAGKTNVLEAISLLSPGRGLRQAQAEDLARRPEGRGWKIVSQVRGEAAVHALETWAEPGGTRQVRIDGKPAPQVALGRILRVVWLVPAMDRLWIEGAEGRRRFLDRLTLSFAPDHAESVLAYDRTMRDRNRLLRDQVTDPHWYAALEAQMAVAARPLMAARAAAVARLQTAQGEDTAFPRATLAIDPGEGAFEGDLAEALAAGRRRDLAAGRTLTGPHRADLSAAYAAKGVPAAQCSTGEQKALLISLILANARALAAEPGALPVLLLDEVAAHLDGDRRAALYDALCGLDAQSFLTGTETALFETLAGRAQRLGVTEEGGVSRIGETTP